MKYLIIALYSTVVKLSFKSRTDLDRF